MVGSRNGKPRHARERLEDFADTLSYQAPLVPPAPPVPSAPASASTPAASTVPQPVKPSPSATPGPAPVPAQTAGAAGAPSAPVAIDSGGRGHAAATRRRPKALIAGIAVAAVIAVVAGAGGGWWMWDRHWRPVPVTVNGTAMSMHVDTTVERLLADNASFSARQGALVAVDGTALDEHGGEPVEVTVNGAPVPPDQRHGMVVPKGAAVTVASGKNVVEDHEVIATPIPHGERIDITGGSIQYRSQKGADGRSEVWVGKVSGKRADKGVTVKPQDMVVEPLDPRPEGRQVIALTFDDGPSEFTDPILDILRDKGVKATFFDVGQDATGLAQAERRMLAEGHQVASHSNTHPYMPGLDRDALRGDITAGFAALKTASGTDTDVLRSPYGAFTEQQWRDAGDLISMNVLWDIDTLDWKRPGPDAILNEVVANAHNGAVALMHDGGGDRSQDVQALPGIIDALKAKGYKFVTIKQLVDMSAK